MKIERIDRTIPSRSERIDRERVRASVEQIRCALQAGSASKGAQEADRG